MGESAPEGATSAWKVDVQFHLDRLPGLEGLLRVLLLRRNPTLSRDQFARHWREVHAPIVLAHQPLFHRYASAVSTAADAPWDGVVLQWFADLATFDRHERLIWAEKRAVAEDLPRFVHDLANTPQFLAART